MLADWLEGAVCSGNTIQYGVPNAGMEYEPGGISDVYNGTETRTRTGVEEDNRSASILQDDQAL